MTKAISVTRDQLAAMNPCGLDDRIKLFGRRKTMTAALAFEAGATIHDLLWVAQRLGHKDKCVKFALACAQRVAHLNLDPRVQACLDATGQYLAFPTEANLAAMRKARATTTTAYATATAYAAATTTAAYATAARQKEISAQQALFIDIFGG